MKHLKKYIGWLFASQIAPIMCGIIEKWAEMSFLDGYTLGLIINSVLLILYLFIMVVLALVELNEDEVKAYAQELRRKLER